MKIDFDQKHELTKRQIVMVLAVCSAVTAFFTLMNSIFGYVFIGITVIVLIMPFLEKIVLGDSEQ